MGSRPGRWTRRRGPHASLRRPAAAAGTANLRPREHEQGPRRLVHRGSRRVASPRADRPGAGGGAPRAGGRGMTNADCRVAFAETLVALAEADPRIVAVVNDSVGSSNLKEFKRRFPDRLINVGIAEQNLVGVSAGLASAGKIPFTCGASCFLTGRALEQVKADLAYSRHNVKLC